MKTKILCCSKKEKMVNTRIVFRIIVFGVALLAPWSCQKDIEKVSLVPLAGHLVLSVSNPTIVLQQKELKSTALSYTWTTGSNKGTGAAISYTFQVDKKGNNFAAPITISDGQAVYSENFTIAGLNDSLLHRWKFKSDTVGQIEARVIATISSPSVKPDTSNIVTVSVTPYAPVTKTLFIYGSATSGGWNIANATAMTVDATDSTIFSYQGTLSVGDFKFPVNKNSNLQQDMYMVIQGDSTHMYLHHANDNLGDNKWHVSTAGSYKIEVDLVYLTITITKLAGTSQLFLVGSAAPNGLDIANATPMVQDAINLSIFYYDGVLTTGDFKFPVNRNTDFKQDMYMRDTTVADSSKIYLHKGGSSDNNMWHINISAFYSIKLNLSNNSISYVPVTNLYIIGDATSNGWNIATAIQMVQDANNKYIYTFTGPLTAGEFKFPVNRQTDWNQNMFMKVDDTHMYLHHGGNTDDNKWTLTAAQAGNYAITVNIQELTISIQKQ